MPTLTQGQQYAGATVNYDAQTGQPLTQGATTTLPTATQPLVNAPISTSSLQQVQQPLEVVQPKIDTAPAFPTLQVTQAETNTQNAYDSSSKNYSSILAELTGQEAYTTQQQQEKDIIGKQSAVQSYSNQLKQLEQEAKGINLRLGLDNEKGLIEASSQGLTKGVYNAQSRGRAQEANRQLLENSNKAYSVGALAAQAQGDLTTALNYVDQAVKVKYQSIEARYKAEQANLENIKNSPDYTSAQKKQALNMEAELKAKQDAVAVQKDNTKTIQGLALQASENNAPPAIISAIMNSPDVISAGIQGRGWTKKETAQSIQEYNFAVRGGYKDSFSQYQNEDANRKAVVARAGAANGVTQGAPTSYKEWELAGGEKGTGKTYGQWVSDSNVKAPTVAQQTVGTYAVRIEQSNPIISNLEKTISSMNPLKFEAEKRLPSYLQSGDFQSYDQASRNYINAVLRRESGAVISPSEFKNAYEQYLPKAGDTENTLKQKKANRDVVFESLKKGAGGAYSSVDELLGKQDQYSSYRSQLQSDEILVNRGGKAVAITPNELQATDIKL